MKQMLKRDHLCTMRWLIVTLRLSASCSAMVLMCRLWYAPHFGGKHVTQNGLPENILCRLSTGCQG